MKQVRVYNIESKCSTIFHNLNDESAVIMAKEFCLLNQIEFNGDSLTWSNEEVIISIENQTDEIPNL